MAPKSPGLQQRFRTAAEQGNLPAMVALAHLEAVTLLTRHGLDAEEERTYIDALAGPSSRSGEDDTLHLRAAFVLGIAMGQLVDRSVFSTDGRS